MKSKKKKHLYNSTFVELKIHVLYNCIASLIKYNYIAGKF